MVIEALAQAATTGPAAGVEIPAGKLAFATVNAILNGTATVLLVVALAFVRRGKWAAHGYTMVAALVVSAVFLACYLSSKLIFREVTTEAMSAGAIPVWAKTVYLAVLFPHLLAAVGMLPLIGMAVWRAYKRDWAGHRRIARPTWYIWFYVSVSGVAVYWMLYHWIPGFRPGA